MEFCVDSEIFKLFPGIRFVCVIAKGIDSGKINKEAIEHMLHEGWSVAGKASVQYGNPQSHPNIKPWVARLKAIGVSRKKFPNSHRIHGSQSRKEGENLVILFLWSIFIILLLYRI